MAQVSNAHTGAVLDPEPPLGAGDPPAAANHRPPDARQLAMLARLRAASRYRPCLFAWVGSRPAASTVERMRARARRREPDSLLLPVGPRSQMLLVPTERSDVCRERLEEAVSELLETARRGRTERSPHAIIGPCIASGEPVATAASRLCRLGRYAVARGETGVIWAPGYGFASLLETHGRQAEAVAERQLSGLAQYDREHGTDLQRVLELALDHGNRNVAAHAAFMHRNTFRRQLRKALELVDADLDRPEERLALHLALKLRTLERR